MQPSAECVCVQAGWLSPDPAWTQQDTDEAATGEALAAIRPEVSQVCTMSSCKDNQMACWAVSCICGMLAGTVALGRPVGPCMLAFQMPPPDASTGCMPRTYAQRSAPSCKGCNYIPEFLHTTG